MTAETSTFDSARLIALRRVGKIAVALPAMLPPRSSGLTPTA
jgi:hypothetical protein